MAMRPHILDTADMERDVETRRRHAANGLWTSDHGSDRHLDELADRYGL